MTGRSWESVLGSLGVAPWKRVAEARSRAESGLAGVMSAADRATTRFWILREDDRVVVAGNMTDWRGRPADVGVLTEPSQRRRGLAGRLVGAMVADALPAVGVVRYRALASNVASLAVAERLGFEPYGQNLRARRPALV